MRKIIFIALSILLKMSGLQSQGVQFYEDGWGEAVEQAKSEEKLLFVDVMADWCMPCQRMNSETFPDPDLGKYMSEKFVSFKANYGTPTGKMLARKYGVSSFPTLLFVDANGNLIYQCRGYRSSKDLMEEARIAADPGSFNKLKLFKKKYNSGNRDPELLEEYLILDHQRFGAPSPEIFNDFFTSLDILDKSTPDKLDVIAMNLPYAEGQAYELAFDHMSQIQDSAKKEEMIDQLSASVVRSLKKDCEEEPGAVLADLLSKEELLLGQRFEMDTAAIERTLADMELDYYECGEHWGEYPRLVQDYAEKYLFSDERFHKDTIGGKSLAQVAQDIKDAEFLAEKADYIEGNPVQRSAIDLAIEWIDRAIVWNDRYEYQKIKALLLYKKGMDSEALRVARRALERATKADSPYAEKLQRVMLEIVDGKNSGKINGQQK